MPLQGWKGMKAVLNELINKMLGSRFSRIYLLIFSIFLALLLGAVIILINGENPFLAYGALLKGAFGAKYKFASTLAKMVPLTLASLATAAAFRAGIFNIGVEGQLYLGAFAAAWVGFTYTSLPWFILIPLCFIAGAVAGGAYAFIPGLLKVRYKVDEVITTIMLNSVAILFTDYLVNYPFAAAKGKMGATDMIAEAAQLDRFVQFSKLNSSIFYMIGIAILMYYLMQKTSIGYNWKMVGENPYFARYGGVNAGKQMLFAMIVSGMIAGVAGGAEVLGVHYRFLQRLSPGYGFDGITVALIVKNNPLGAVIMSFFFAVLKTGGVAMEQATKIPYELVSVIQAIIILFIAAERGFHYYLVRRKGGLRANV